MHQFPARIHVPVARDAPVGLVIRRGPSKCVATLQWNRGTDEFVLGQSLNIPLKYGFGCAERQFLARSLKYAAVP
jgi:hypothetical protein